MLLKTFINSFKRPGVFPSGIASNSHKSVCFTASKCVSPQPNLTFPLSKHFHSSVVNRDKIFVDSENVYAYALLPDIPLLKPLWNVDNRIDTIEAFDQFMNQDWRSSNATAIVDAFEKIKDISIANNIPLSDQRFDKLVDGLMDHCEKLTDNELLKLLSIVLELPQCESSTAHNFHDVWSCLDDICCWKMSTWNINTKFTFADVWYRLKLGRLSDYVFELLDQVMVKPQRLSKNMLLYTYFYLNVNRRKQVPFETEHVLAQKIYEFNVDELAVVAMGYFKTKTKVKTVAILEAMIKAIEENSETINEISLSAMLKVIRFSQRLETAPQISPLLDKLTEQIDRLSIMGLVHVALLGTSLQVKHSLSIKKCAERIIQDVYSVRIKDIERMLVACSMFDVDTNPSIFELAHKELSKETRRQELIKYNRCLPSILNYLSLRKIYHYDSINQVLNEDYINETYGKASKNVPRDILSIDNCVDIECPDYQGNRLSPTKRYKASKWLTEYAPTPAQHKRLTLSDKAYLEVWTYVTEVAGAERFVRNDHVLPHFSKADIILCRNKVSGEFVEPFGFANYVLGDVKRPLDSDKFDWFAIVVMTPTLAVRDQCLPLGSMIMKERQLKAIGYKPILVYTTYFTTLSPQEKVAFIKNQLE